MRALISSSTVGSGDLDLHAHYATAWIESGGVRANFVASADGAVSASGRSRGLQTPGDNRVFAALRDLADVVLVGAGTARAEGYRPARISDERAAVRDRYGLRSELPIAIVSRSLNLDVTSNLFGADTSPRTLVFTCEASDAGARTALSDRADVVVCGDLAVDLLAVRTALEERGLNRILLEGGPHLFSDMAAAGAIDELCLSTSPMLVGPASSRITAGLPWTDAPLRLDLLGLLEEDGALFSRYGVAPAHIAGQRGAIERAAEHGTFSELPRGDDAR